MVVVVLDVGAQSTRSEKVTSDCYYSQDQTGEGALDILILETNMREGEGEGELKVKVLVFHMILVLF